LRGLVLNAKGSDYFVDFLDIREKVYSRYELRHFGSKAAEYNLGAEKGDDYVGSSVLHISG
jgi:hypothetical protein